VRAALGRPMIGVGVARRACFHGADARPARALLRLPVGRAGST
jgi:hypothetical protein